jgi:VanZ family protein
MVWFLVILGLCSTPGQYIPSASWLELLSFDKWVHAGIFFVLCYLISVSVIKKEGSFFLAFILFMLSIIYGGALEIMQATLFTQRTADWQDFVANSFGCFVAMLFFRKLRKNYSHFSSASSSK